MPDAALLKCEKTVKGDVVKFNFTTYPIEVCCVPD